MSQQSDGTSKQQSISSSSSSSLSFTQSDSQVTQPDSQFQVVNVPARGLPVGPFTHPSCCSVRWTGMHVCVSVCIEGGGKLHSSSLPAHFLPTPPPSPAPPSLPLSLIALKASSRSQDWQTEREKLRKVQAQTQAAQVAQGLYPLEVGRCDAGKVGWLEGTPAPDDAAFQGSFHLFPAQQLVPSIQTRETTPDVHLLCCLLVTASSKQPFIKAWQAPPNPIPCHPIFISLVPRLLALISFSSTYRDAAFQSCPPSGPCLWNSPVSAADRLSFVPTVIRAVTRS